MKTLDATKKISELKEDLSREECAEVFEEIMSGEVPEAVIAAFLVALKMKGVAARELVAAVSILRKRAHFINAGGRYAIDTCGTGGDGLNTFNISTTSAFIAAGAGATVAKHGGKAAHFYYGADHNGQHRGDFDPDDVKSMPIGFAVLANALMALNGKK